MEKYYPCFYKWKKDDFLLFVPYKIASVGQIIETDFKIKISVDIDKLDNLLCDYVHDFFNKKSSEWKKDRIESGITEGVVDIIKKKEKAEGLDLIIIGYFIEEITKRFFNHENNC